MLDLPFVAIGRQMAINNSVSNDFLSTLVNRINIFNCRLSSVITVFQEKIVQRSQYQEGLSDDTMYLNKCQMKYFWVCRIMALALLPLKIERQTDRMEMF